MVIWSDFRLRKYRDDDHRENAPHFMISITQFPSSRKRFQFCDDDKTGDFESFLSTLQYPNDQAYETPPQLVPSNLQSTDPQPKSLLAATNKTEATKSSDVNNDKNALVLPKLPPDSIDTYYFNKHAVVEFLYKKQHSYNTKMDDLEIDEFSN